MDGMELSRIFVAIVAVLAAAIAGGFAFQLVRLPRVVGEIAGGLLLGPTVLGFFWPAAESWLLGSGEDRSSALEFLHWLGLVLLMFVSGFRVQQHLSRDDGVMIGIVLLAATVAPFALGWLAVGWFDLGRYMGAGANPLAFQIVMAIAVTVTSIPVISKIFIDLDLMGTRFAKIVLGCATIQDLVLWAALAVATGLGTGAAAEASVDSIDVLQKIGITAAFVIAALSIVRAMMLGTARALPRGSGGHPSATGIVLGTCFVFAAAAAALGINVVFGALVAGINVVFGALVAGIVIGSMPQASFERIKDRIAEVSLAFFVPIYFGLVGAELDLIHAFDPGLTLAFVAGSTAIVMACVFGAALAAGRTTLTGFNLAMAMNTRGGPGIVLASVAYGLGIIGEVMFTTLVLAAMVTSAVSGAWFVWAKRHFACVRAL